MRRGFTLVSLVSLVSLDWITAGDIVAFSQRTYEDKWRKRFEEDRVEARCEFREESVVEVTHLGTLT